MAVIIWPVSGSNFQMCTIAHERYRQHLNRSLSDNVLSFWQGSA